MTFNVRLTAGAQKDLTQLFSFLAEKDLAAAYKAKQAIQNAYKLLETMPFSCRKADDDNPFLRELIISFGNSGYIALFEIENDSQVTILAMRHQREEDYF